MTPDFSVLAEPSPVVTEPQPSNPPARPRRLDRLRHPARSDLALAGIAILAAVLYVWGLGGVGYGNTYYAAAVKAGTKSWKAFFFGSIDPGNFITVDKPPAALSAWALWSAVETGRTRWAARGGRADRPGLRHQDAAGVPGPARLHRRLPHRRAATARQAAPAAERGGGHARALGRLVGGHRGPVAGGLPALHRQHHQQLDHQPDLRLQRALPDLRGFGQRAIRNGNRRRPELRWGGRPGADVQQRRGRPDFVADPPCPRRSHHRAVAHPPGRPCGPRAGRLASLGTVGRGVPRDVQPGQRHLPPVLHRPARPGDRRPGGSRLRRTLGTGPPPPGSDGVGAACRRRRHRRPAPPPGRRSCSVARPPTSRGSGPWCWPETSSVPPGCGWPTTAPGGSGSWRGPGSQRFPCWPALPPMR